jgi:hypothetical protein
MNGTERSVCIPAHGRLKQNCEFEASLDCKARQCLKKKKKEIGGGRAGAWVVYPESLSEWAG